MRTAIHQPNLFPNAAFFYKLHMSDVFVLLNLVDMNYRSYIHRCKLPVNNKDGSVWGTLSVSKSNKSISDVVLNGTEEIKTRITGLYGKSASTVIDMIKANESSKSMVEFNTSLLVAVADLVGIDSKKFVTDEYVLNKAGYDIKDYLNLDGSKKMALLTHLTGGSVYLSGSGAKAYNKSDDFEKVGVNLMYTNYSETPYKQKNSPTFVPGSSCVDYICNNVKFDFL